MSLGAFPSAHEHCQNFAVWPFPTVTIMLALKNCLSISSHGMSKPAQGLSGLVHSYHNHRSRRALLKAPSSRILNPPICFGIAVFCHLTKQCPPFTCFDPFQRKLLLILSSFFKAHFLSLKTVMKYMGIEDMTILTSVNLPALSRSFPFRVYSFPATLSINGRIWTLVSFLVLSGRLK